MIVYRGVHGVVRANFFWPGVINAFSAVQITAGEVNVGATEPTPPGAKGQNFFYILGAANVSCWQPTRKRMSGSAPKSWNARWTCVVS